MRLLLDTHALIWWFEGSPKLTTPAVQAIADRGNDVSVSAVSAFELTTKHRAGKLPDVAPLLPVFDKWLVREGFLQLDITLDHARLAGSMAIPHRDPWDRLLIAQAQVEDMVLISNEMLFDDWGVKRLW